MSGDSGGSVQFWDGAHGTLLHSFHQHQAGVLALAASPAGDAVFASGIDHQVWIRHLRPLERTPRSAHPFSVPAGTALPRPA